MAKRFSRKWNPKSWVNLVPTGLGQVKPHHFREMLRAAWENRDQPGYAWRILRDGCCDGCALGTMGMRDWTLPGTHLCMVRLNLLRLNTMPAMDPALLEDVSRLGGKSGRELRSLGRLAYPMVRRRGEKGFRRITWDEALDLAAERIRRTKPERIAFYLTSRGLTNEVYFAANKVARFLGTNHIDNAARLCHAPSTVALKKAIGYGATTISYSDWIGTDLLILVGTNLANNQPVATKYIYYAKKAGTRVIVVNPYKEEGLERYWIPSVTESALFGTRIMDEFFQIGTGGDAAFFNGALKHLVETGKVNEEFIRNHTAGFEEVRRFVSEIGWKELEKSAGTSREEMRRFAEIYARANSSVIVWSMGVTQHRNGTNNVLSIVNLALALGRIGKPHSGLCPIRGHSGVQGGAEMGAVPDSYGMDRPVDEETAKAIGELWGFPVPDRPGMKASSMIQAAHDGKLDVLYSIGGNFLETLPDPDFVREAIARVPLRIHQDIVLNPQMLVEPRDPQGTVLLLPGRTRYETPGGVTETTTERRVIFSPEIPGPRIGETRPEWEIPVQIAERVHPDRAHLIHYDGTAQIREDISRIIPAYDGIQHLKKKGDNFQWGGPRLCEGYKFNTPDGRARFHIARLPEDSLPEGRFILSTRRGKQFNSIVWGERDPLTGAGRDEVFISRQDAKRLGLEEGDPILLRSESGEYRGRVKIARIRPGNLQVHWPEGNVLIPYRRFDPDSGEPDYNAVVEAIPLNGRETGSETASAGEG
ncbi:oxidoreductase alpha (molybdopterin) subunit [Planifilum fulgidum]|jgi:molybdopterin-dependent oxidoreductase alpha subunit|uniref:Oxidoreductase alpha (Molybdopterin) subunit n=1 Tax=Planifilum fulgidum TaxID=201973 RepID=A0A1I2KQR4_9BACL|nr:FdhF/YdeP family oxidoreductase [Planifilum fulgidum]MBO2533734.1 formate dehydrogenase [Thermoactinomycetaceae bacterium]SFF67461.1 oxidoreductase alpha (molybdopterin) subunit [Planifilum fulgidum]